MDISDHDTCQNKLRKASRPNSSKLVLGSRFTLHSSFLCAGGDVDQDTCTGDGGSPLVCPEKGGDRRYFQVGINSKIFNVEIKAYPIKPLVPVY